MSGGDTACVCCPCLRRDKHKHINTLVSALTLCQGPVCVCVLKTVQAFVRARVFLSTHVARREPNIFYNRCSFGQNYESVNQPP